MMKSKAIRLAAGFALAWILARPAFAQTNAPTGAAESGDDMAEIAKKLNNPVASLITVPFQNNFDFGGGPNGDGFQYKLNLQPVVPYSLNDDWNLISRTIMPYIYQHDIIGTSSQTGLGDTTESLFLSPHDPGPGGLIWGLGPIFYLPTATETTLGAEKWGAGPTGVLLWQKHGWTYGILANQVWSFAGNSARQEVNSTFLQPFLAYTTRQHTTFGMNTESTYDWDNHQWTVPLNGFVTQLVRVGKMPVSFQVGGRYYADKPDNGPDWGLRFTITLILPK